MPPICLEHGIYYRENQCCSKCGVRAWNEARQKNKEEKQTIKKFEKKIPTKLNKLLNNAQKILSSNLKSKYCKGKYVNCAICLKPVLTKGTNIMNTVHCGHYFPKSEYWELAHLEENNCEVCYDCNVNKPHTAPAMRYLLVQRFGEEKIKELELRAAKFMIEIKTGIKKRKPDKLYLLAITNELKQRK